MKKALFIILFLTLSFTGFAQQNVIVNNGTKILVANKTEKSKANKISISAEVKAKILKMNRKKSNEIISIKAYRKSLQIRVKTKKFC